MKELELLQLIEKQLADEPFSVDGILQKWLIISKAQNGDEELLRRLLASAELKGMFFKQIDAVHGALVFDHQKFVYHMEMKSFLKDSYTEYKNKIGLHTGGQYLKPNGDVVLAWPYKDCVLAGGQTRADDKRNEVFFNQTLAHDEITQLLTRKVLTAAVRYTAKGKNQKVQLNRDAQINKARGLPADTITDNLLIKGNNLLALHSLKEQFSERVKLIYIDPPYNTGGEANIFTYNNNFNHSTWLTFMKNRLEVARELLREDGCIAIAIDHAELFYLGVLTDEVFGRDNRLGVITVVHKPEGRQFAKGVNPTNEFMLWYAKNSSEAQLSTYPIDEDKLAEFDMEDHLGKFRWEDYIRMGGGNTNLRENKKENWYPVYVSLDLSEISMVKKKNWQAVLPVNDTGTERTWNTSKETFEKKIRKNDVKAEKVNGRLTIFRKIRASQTIKTHWDKSKYNSTRCGTRELNQLIGVGRFSYPKSIYTVLDTLKIMTGKTDIVLDFFAGSGTTGHAVLKLNKEDGGNRQFILVEQLDSHIAVCQERLQKIIAAQNGDDFVYFELKQRNQKFADEIQAATTTRMLVNIWENMKQSAFLDYNLDIAKQEENLTEFKALPLQQQQDFLLEILDKNQMYVNLSDMHDSKHNCSSGEKRITTDFYGLEK